MAATTPPSLRPRWSKPTLVDAGCVGLCYCVGAPGAAPLRACSTQRLVDGCTRAAPCGRGAAGEVRSSCAGANTTNKHTRTYTEVLCIQGFDLSPSHAVSTQFGVEMKLLTRASERFWVRDPPMWTRISRFNSCQQQLGLHVIRRRVRYPRRKCEISFWEGDVLGFKSHSLHRTNREKECVKFHFYSESSADWMKTRFAGYMGW